MWVFHTSQFWIIPGTPESIGTVASNSEVISAFGVMNWYRFGRVLDGRVVLGVIVGDARSSLFQVSPSIAAMSLRLGPDLGFSPARCSVAAVWLRTMLNRFRTWTTGSVQTQLGSASQTNGSVQVQHNPENVKPVLSWFEPNQTNITKACKITQS